MAPRKLHMSSGAMAESAPLASPLHASRLHRPNVHVKTEKETAYGKIVVALSSQGTATPQHEAAPSQGTATPPYEAASSQDNSARLPFSADKQRYNKFNYKLRLAPAQWREDWKVLRSQELLAPQQFMAFVDKVINFEAKGKVTKKRLIENSDSTLLEKAWVSFKVAEEAEGYEVLMEQIKANTLRTRPHPRLPPNSSIVWPYNLQVRMIGESERSKKKQSDADEDIISLEGLEDLDTFDAKFSCSQLTNFPQHSSGGSTTTGATSSESGVSSAGGAPSQALSPEEVRDRTTVAHARKAHSAFDRAKREFEGTLLQSSANMNTKGCKFEQDLKDLIIQGSGIDSKLIEIEQKHISGQRLVQTEVDLVAVCGKDLKQMIKSSMKLSAAMKQWFKL